MPTRRAEAQRFDKTIKKLFQTLPSQMVEWLTGQPPVELLTVEFPTVESRSADLVYRLPNGEIHHIELQSDNDETMDMRMLEYYPRIWRVYKRPPVQHVLYLGNKPLKMKGRINHPRLKYSVEVTDIREFEAEPLIKSNSLSDNLIGLLCHNGATRASVRRILRKIARLPERQRIDALKQLLILSGLREIESIVKEEGQQMSLELSIENNSFLREIFLEGEKKSDNRLRHLVLRQFEQRFGKLPKWAAQQLETADAATLVQWGERVLEAKNLEEIIPKPRATRSHIKR